MATLTVTQNFDYRGGASEEDITEIVFQGAGNFTATFAPTQFGPGLIENDVALVGGAASNIRVLFASTGTFSAAANGSDKFDLTAVAGIDDIGDLTITDNGSNVTVDYGSGSFTIANLGDTSQLDATDFIL